MKKILALKFEKVFCLISYNIISDLNLSQVWYHRFLFSSAICLVALNILKVLKYPKHQQFIYFISIEKIIFLNNIKKWQRPVSNPRSSDQLEKLLFVFSEQLLAVILQLDRGYSEWLGFIYQELAMTLSQLRKLVGHSFTHFSLIFLLIHFF